MRQKHGLKTRHYEEGRERQRHTDERPSSEGGRYEK